MHPLQSKPNRPILEEGGGSSDDRTVRAGFVLKPFQLGSKPQDTSPSTPESIVPAPNIDRGVYKKLRRGKTKLEARIDLHGMSADRAYDVLCRFLFRAHGSGKRMVLVITGKGRQLRDMGPIPARSGVLRQSLPSWVVKAPLKEIVQDIVEANPRHGGSGAFYVYLRRAK
ncbi:MAG: DNA mismatch repair protein MutS [Silicimonas sp.]|nr:DNA mismatch repair protein MutS [Silicimonas sp.]